MYENSENMKIKNIRVNERSSLITALTLGVLLNRIVILPKFNCFGCQSDVCKKSTKGCSLNSHFSLKQFDKYFEEKYREHVFLRHPKVPMKIKKSISPTIHVVKKNSLAKKKENNKKDLYITKKNEGVSVKDVREWLTNGVFNDYYVLRFHSKHGKDSCNENKIEDLT